MPPSTRRHIPTTAVLVLATLLASDARAVDAEESPLVAAAKRGRVKERFQTCARIKAGMRAPSISATVWLNTPTAIKFGSKPVLLDFWDMNCGRCSEHKTALNRIVRRHSGLSVVSLHRKTDVAALRDYVEATEMRTAVAMDSGATRAAYGVTGVPTYFLIDRDGIVRAKLHTPPTDQQLRQYLGSGFNFGAAATLAEIASDVKLTKNTVIIRPVQPGEKFAGISATQWLNTTAPIALQNRPALIDFWAVWCQPCLEKLPVVQSYASRYAGKLDVVGVHYQSEAAPVQSVLQQRRLTIPVAIDDGTTWTRSSINYVPTYLLLDKQGVVRFKGNTPPTETQIATLIAEP